jgi:inorganic pyrophosphatase
VGRLCTERTGRPAIEGDGDPLDVCVLTERPITHGDILVRARPIGGLLMIDGNQADDKIVAVLEKDLVHGTLQDIAECPSALVDRLRHYFLTYKLSPGRPETTRAVEITHVYGREDAHEVIRRSQADYARHFAG